MSGVHFVRSPLQAPNPNDSTISGSITNWLESERTEIIAKLSGDGVLFHELSPQGQAVVGKLANMRPGITDAILSGQPVGIGLSASPTAHVQGGESFLSVGQYNFNREQKLVQAAAKVQANVEIKRYNDSKKLEIRTLQSWVKLLKAKYGKVILHDPRLNDCLFAVFGELEPAQLFQAIYFASMPQANLIADWKRADRSDIINPILDGLKVEEETYEGLGTFKPEDFRAGKETTIGQLAAQSDNIKQHQEFLKLSGSEKVTLDLALSLSIWTPGNGPMPGSTATINGKSVPSMTPNWLKFLIVP